MKSLKSGSIYDYTQDPQFRQLCDRRIHELEENPEQKVPWNKTILYRLRNNSVIEDSDSEEIVQQTNQSWGNYILFLILSGLLSMFIIL